ncbi:MAG: hypothetical protein AAFR59_20085, partial [Bacteroidota bacterium]
KLLTRGSEYDIVRDTVFLEVLIEGAFTLYVLEEARGRRNFYIRTADGPELLRYRRYLQMVEGRPGTGEQRGFVEQLLAYAQDCPVLQDDILNAEYTRESLIALFQNIYRCQDQRPDFFLGSEAFPQELGGDNRRSIPLHIGFLGGGRATLIKPAFLESVNPTYASFDFMPSIDPLGGVFLEIFLKPSWQGLTWRNELVYGNYQVVAAKTGSVSVRELDVLNQYLEISSLLRWRFNSGVQRFFATGGISLPFENNIRSRELIKRVDTGALLTGFPVDLIDENYSKAFIVLGGGWEYKNFG